MEKEGYMKSGGFENRMSVVVLALFVLLYLAGTAGAEEWVELFDGATLNGWTQKNGTATYRVENGTIVGRTTEGSPNSFLCTVKEYGDFELEFEVKVDDKLNSGVQIRSKTKTQATGKGSTNAVGRVYGPQVEIEASGESGAQAGYVYGEATGRGWLEQEIVPNLVEGGRAAVLKPGSLRESSKPFTTKENRREETISHSGFREATASQPQRPHPPAQPKLPTHAALG